MAGTSTSNAPPLAVSKTLVHGLRDGEGWLLRQEMVDCGKGEAGRCRKCAQGPGHGPYWYRYRWYDGKMHKRYVGKLLLEPTLSRRAGGDEFVAPADEATPGTGQC
jgi:hypothetical protein